jgi:hypothetical protein
METDKIKKYFIFIIPIFYLIWSLQLNLLGGPFSLSRSDPEYPYLLNGLNCATLHFNNIGHTDHPGTPFQIITGIFIRITHFVNGQGPIVEDVLSRPETYLSSASLGLSILTFLLLLWLGRLVMRKDGRMTGALMLQSSILLSTVLIDMPLRYNPDRMLIIFNLLFAGMMVRFLSDNDYPVRKFALATGVLMGIGFATKFNYLPVAVIPLMLIPGYRNKAVYSLTFIVSFFVGILPILNKFKEFRRFISGVASHDGLYGQGSEQMFNWKGFGHNFVDLLSYNISYTIILVAAAGLVILYLAKGGQSATNRRLIITLQAFLLASAVGFIMVSKHFKVYYFAPVLSLSGLALFIIWKISEVHFPAKRIHNLFGPVVLAVLLIVPMVPLPGQFGVRLAAKQANLKTSRFYAENVGLKDWLFIEPTWMAGPMVENALVYGISYVAHRQEFYRDYTRLYPNVVTWEGADKNPWLFRTAEADPESILFSGGNIFVYSSPGRNADVLLNYIDTLASRFGTRVSRDTAFFNDSNGDRVIRVANTDGWKTLLDRHLITESTGLSTASPVTENIPINGVIAGDYLEVTLNIKDNDPDARCRIIARSVNSDQDKIYFEDSGSLQDIGRGWQLLRLRGKVPASPSDGRMVCQVYYPGNRKVLIQHLKIKHMGRR